MTAPTTRTGRPLKHLGRGYFVLLDSAMGEVSERAWGEAWLGATSPGKMHVIIHPDNMDSAGVVILKPTSAAYHLATCVDIVGPVALRPTRAQPDDTVSVIWDP